MTILKKYRVIFIMERFHYDAFNILTRYTVPVDQAASTFRQMLEIIEIITAHGIFCRDIKPSNFVANIIQSTGEVMVRMIDFGGNFCQVSPPDIIANIREHAGALRRRHRRREKRDLRDEDEVAVTLQPKLRTFFGATSGRSDDYPKLLFTRIIQVLLILKIFKTMMWQLKAMGGNNVRLCTSDLRLPPGPSKYCRYNKIVSCITSRHVNECYCLYVCITAYCSSAPKHINIP